VSVGMTRCLQSKISSSFLRIWPAQRMFHSKMPRQVSGNLQYTFLTKSARFAFSWISQRQTALWSSEYVQSIPLWNLQNGVLLTVLAVFLDSSCMWRKIAWNNRRCPLEVLPRFWCCLKVSFLLLHYWWGRCWTLGKLRLRRQCSNDWSVWQ